MGKLRDRKLRFSASEGCGADIQDDLADYRLGGTIADTRVSCVRVDGPEAASQIIDKLVGDGCGHFAYLYGRTSSWKLHARVCDIAAAYRRGILRAAALALVVIGLVSGLAVYAFFQRHEARKSEKRANDARDQADGLINFMLYDLRDKLGPIGRLDVLDDVAKKAKEYLDRLPKELVTPARLEQQATMISNYFGDVLVAQGKLQEALETYQQYLAIMKRPAEQDKT